MQSLIAASLLLGLLSAESRAQAWSYADSNNSAYSVLTPVLASAFPTKALESGQLTVKLAPGYFRYSDGRTTTQDSGNGFTPGSMGGFAAGAGAHYAFTPHLGVGLQLGFANGNGQELAGFASCTTPGVACTGPFNGSAKISGIAAAAGLIVDPFSSPDGFRLPLWAGLGYLKVNESVTASGFSQGKSFSLDTESNQNALGISLGASAQFNTGPTLRWVPFGMLVYPAGAKLSITQTCSGNVSCANQGPPLSPSGHQIIALGLGGTYLPWNLGALMVPPAGIGAQRTSFYSLKWNHTFGGR